LRPSIHRKEIHMRFVRGTLIIATLLFAACQSETAPQTDTSAEYGKADRGGKDCDLVKCPMPLCVQGQHLAYQGSCCPTCVGGQPSRCADVLCPALACAIGYELVTNNGECCGRCMPSHPVAECTVDADCPQFYCFACPCPYSTCQGRQCVTQTPSADTCAGEIP
jgi:hypothetical protein